LSKIPYRQAYELIATRFELHPLQQFARTALMLDAALRKPAQVLGAAGQSVAHPLQLLQCEQARATNGFATEGRNICRGEVRERVGNDRRALALDLSDLHPQGDASVTLTDLDLAKARD
jgi:hypothetical protein